MSFTADWMSLNSCRLASDSSCTSWFFRCWSLMLKSTAVSWSSAYLVLNWALSGLRFRSCSFIVSIWAWCPLTAAS